MLTTTRSRESTWSARKPSIQLIARLSTAETTPKTVTADRTALSKGSSDAYRAAPALTRGSGQTKGI